MLKAQVELGKLGDRLLTLNEMREPMSAMFNVALNRPYNDLLPWPHKPELSGIVLDELVLFEQLALQNPELRAMDAGRILWPNACGRLIYGSASHIPEPHAKHAIEGWKYLLDQT